LRAAREKVAGGGTPSLKSQPFRDGLEEEEEERHRLLPRWRSELVCVYVRAGQGPKPYSQIIAELFTVRLAGIAMKSRTSTARGGGGICQVNPSNTPEKPKD